MIQGLTLVEFIITFTSMQTFFRGGGLLLSRGGFKSGFPVKKHLSCRKQNVAFSLVHRASLEASAIYI